MLSKRDGDQDPLAHRHPPRVKETASAGAALHPAAANASHESDDQAHPARRRLLFVGTTFVLGGAERVLFHLVRGLAGRHHVELLALREPGAIGEEIRALGIPVHSDLTGATKLDPFVIPRIHGLLKRGRYDAIYFLDHAHAVFYTTLACAGTSVRVRVMPVHTTGQWNGAPSLKRPIRLVRSRLARIIAIAEAQREYLMREEGVPAEQLVVIHNGIPLESPERTERHWRREQIRTLVGVAGDVPVIGITAVLRPEKNHELLLDALLRIRGRVGSPLARTELWIIGDGPRRTELEEKTRALGLVEAVRFFGKRSDARRLMAGMDVAVLSSHPRVETLPLSLLEAMDAGLPVVATRVGALAEMVIPGRTGYLVEAGDAAELSGALARVLEDRSHAEELGAQGQALARAQFSDQRMVDETDALLQALLR